MLSEGDPTVTDDYWVHIRYPFDGQVDDQPWLVEAVADHGGTLSDILLRSMPGQTGAGFRDRQSADVFTSLLNATGRWQARVTG